MTETSAASPGLVDGSYDLVRAAEDLAARLPAEMAGFARIAYNYLWSWTPGGTELFAAIDPVRWERSNCNPVRLLLESSAATLGRMAADARLIEQAGAVLATIEADRERPALAGRASAAHPVAFLCAEFAVHTSLPIYAGGLGVLAGDILKEASDLAVPMVAVGLLYRQGYFLQRMDRTGYQHEYWMPLDPER
ncbi:MAG TPA: DUF3417 domain-containing protein, partial [Candidatus Deferrimicrobium sp.]|nr:DUF3417 domain-containing protein [Candidatus Deferrimicrobium sp.]